jgi:hypothetical protein
MPQVATTFELQRGSAAAASMLLITARSGHGSGYFDRRDSLQSCRTIFTMLIFPTVYAWAGDR